MKRVYQYKGFQTDVELEPVFTQGAGVKLTPPKAMAMAAFSVPVCIGLAWVIHRGAEVPGIRAGNAVLKLWSTNAPRTDRPVTN